RRSGGADRAATATWARAASARCRTRSVPPPSRRRRNRLVGAAGSLAGQVAAVVGVGPAGPGVRIVLVRGHPLHVGAHVPGARLRVRGPGPLARLPAALSVPRTAHRSSPHGHVSVSCPRAPLPASPRPHAGLTWP